MVCHGDFHPLNVMVDGERASVIDWTDAGLGPRETDVARTALIFHIAAVAANSAVERAVLKVAGPRLSRRYLKTYEAGSRLDPTRMRMWEVLHGVHGWAQVEMLHAGGFDGSSSAEPGQIPLSVRDFLRERVQPPSHRSERAASAGSAWSVTRDGDAVEDPVGVAVVPDADVGRRPVVPHDDIAGVPPVAVGALRCRRHVVQQPQEGVALGAGDAEHARREGRVDEQSTPTGDGVHPHDWVHDGFEHGEASAGP